MSKTIIRSWHKYSQI